LGGGGRREDPEGVSDSTAHTARLWASMAQKKTAEGGRGIIVGNLNRMGKDHQLGVPHSHWQTKYEGALSSPSS
jgi:hypothetical protein